MVTDTPSSRNLSPLLYAVYIYYNNKQIIEQTNKIK